MIYLRLQIQYPVLTMYIMIYLKLQIQYLILTLYIIIYHIFRLKYRCFVYALSMIVPSLYRLPYIAYPISHLQTYIAYLISYRCLLRRLRYIDRFSEIKSTCDVNLLSKLSIIFKEWRVTRTFSYTYISFLMKLIMYCNI